MLPNGKKASNVPAKTEKDEKYYQYNLEDLSTSNTESSYSEKHDAYYNDRKDRHNSYETKTNANQSLNEQKEDNTYVNVAFSEEESTIL